MPALSAPAITGTRVGHPYLPRENRGVTDKRKEEAMSVITRRRSRRKSYEQLLGLTSESMRLASDPSLRTEAMAQQLVRAHQLFKENRLGVVLTDEQHNWLKFRSALNRPVYWWPVTFATIKLLRSMGITYTWEIVVWAKIPFTRKNGGYPDIDRIVAEIDRILASERLSWDMGLGEVLAYRDYDPFE